MNELHNEKVQKLERKAAGWAWGGVISILACVFSFIVSKDYMNAADRELKNDPNYLEAKRKEDEQKRIMREKELEVERQKYILEQQRLEVIRENKKMDELREKQAKALETIDEFAENAEDCNDYELVDNAYQILDILKETPLGNQVKYRALACLSKFENEVTMNSEESKKIHGIIDEIEDM